jgi:spoIIIJ-associated protein
VTDVPTHEPPTDAPADRADDLAEGQATLLEQGPAEAAAGGKRPAAAHLEDEGEVAADYLEELLDIADLDGDIDIDVENGRAAVSILADPVATRSLRRLTGPDGEVLEALQELTRLAVQTKTGERSRLMLDVAGFRAARRTELQGVAERAVAEAERTGGPVRLDPMSPFERKVVHDAVASAGLVSESEGEEPHRRVVVLPRQA